MKKVKPKYEIQFNTAYYTVSAIFSQVLVWIGVYFSPFLVGLQLIKLLIIFLIKSVNFF